MDPDDFLRLKNQLSIKATNESEAFCFRSMALIELTQSSKDLKRRLPDILGVEVDPKGGPRIQEAAMAIFHRKGDVAKIHLLQAFQAIERAVKRFYFAYRQLIGATILSADAITQDQQSFKELIYALFVTAETIVRCMNPKEAVEVDIGIFFLQSQEKQSNLGSSFSWVPSCHRKFILMGLSHGLD
ncbi:nematode resistance protein-like HSPRO2 isoform X2 [Magnolia sinica]|uniref:nematode resistance protein-like HSPRO2 isoform X2 n=1 Tax=Magnolia sinica TaxID=86752 RepID=UPI002659C1BB|nr:nematode resistance protein-like HSPRO2 isoform X2 [Magnolia sinica]